MGGMKVSELEFMRLLPAFMRDDEAAIALSKAMNRLIGEPSKRLKTISVWGEIDNLTEKECDETKTKAGLMSPEDKKKLWHGN